MRLVWGRAREMAQQIQCLPRKCEDRSSDPCNTWKTLHQSPYSEIGGGDRESLKLPPASLVYTRQRARTDSKTVL